MWDWGIQKMWKFSIFYTYIHMKLNAVKFRQKSGRKHTEVEGKFYSLKGSLMGKPNILSTQSNSNLTWIQWNEFSYYENGVTVSNFLVTEYSSCSTISIKFHMDNEKFPDLHKTAKIFSLEFSIEIWHFIVCFHH